MRHECEVLSTFFHSVCPNIYQTLLKVTENGARTIGLGVCKFLLVLWQLSLYRAIGLR